METQKEAVPTPGAVLKRKLKERGWTQDQLAEITGRSVKSISDVARGRTGITADMATCLASAFNEDAAEWMQYETDYKLALVDVDVDGIKRAARVHEIAPLAEMEKRGWLPETKSIEEKESYLKAFFSIEDISQRPQFPISFKRRASLPALSKSEIAWAFRCRQLARVLQCGPFDPSKMTALERRLRELAAFPKEARKLPKMLSDYGIRFVVVEPLPGTVIDGAAFWLDDSSPVICASLRKDTIDNFWFTVFHEFTHIKNGDAFSIDSDILDEEEGNPGRHRNDAEEAANVGAANALVPLAEMRSFIGRVGPLYSTQRIIQFANRIKIHPGIIVGQLQNKGEIGHFAHKELHVKIRDVVVNSALTDGWGQILSPGAI